MFYIEISFKGNYRLGMPTRRLKATSVKFSTSMNAFFCQKKPSSTPHSTQQWSYMLGSSSENVYLTNE